MENRIMVTAQKTDPTAVIVRRIGRPGFTTTVINVLEDGAERKYKISCERKKDLLADLQKLPIASVRGMGYAQDGSCTIELMKYNGV